MPTYSGAVLSGSTNGKPIPVTGTATGSAVTIHTAVVGTSGFDEIYLWVSNPTNASATLTLEWGGTTDPGDHLVKQLSVPANSPPVPVAAGLRMNNGLLVKAFSGTASALNITGFINRVN